MADTNRPDATQGVLVEGDGINYRGIVWFVVVLAITVAISQVLMWGMFEVMARRVAGADAPRAPLALPAGAPPQGPALLLDEPANLRDFRIDEELRLNSYGWIDRNAGTVRLPIERAKALLLERGLPAREPQQNQQDR
jgi:hypothetical protein